MCHTLQREPQVSTSLRFELDGVKTGLGFSSSSSPGFFSRSRHEDRDCNGGRTSKRRRSEGMCMHVRFGIVTRVRRFVELVPDVDAAGHDSAGASGDIQTRKQDAAESAAERRYSFSDSYVQTKIEDGPCLIAQITSELVVGVSNRRVHNLATIMLTIRTTLVKLGWTTISDSLEFHVLCAVNEKLHTIIMSLQENGAASLLPGSMRIDHSYQQVLCEVQARVQLAADAIIARRKGALVWQCQADGLAAAQLLATASPPPLSALADGASLSFWAVSRTL